MQLLLRLGILTTYLVFLIFIKQNEAADCTNLQKINLTLGYATKGRIVMTAGMMTYETGNITSNKILIVIYDKGGFAATTTNVFQDLDIIGELGYKIVMPDFFHGINYERDHEHLPFPQDHKLEGMERFTDWDMSVKEDLGLVLEAYKDQNNASEFGVLGFCWGGKMTALTLGEYYEDIQIGAMFHPFDVNITDATKIKRPALLMPGANDPDMTEYCEIINTNLGNGSCVYHHFRDVNHGFAGSGANWNNNTIRIRAEEAVVMFEQFLCDKFPV